jgi:N6-adenosine-specific RNA methylase IME4
MAKHNTGRGSIIIDPPWPYSLVKENDRRLTGYSQKQYQSLSIEELQELNVGELGDYAFLWSTVAFVESAYQIMRAWGFKPVTMLFAVKVDRIGNDSGRILFQPHTGVGYWFRGVVEPILVGKKPRAESLRTQYLGLLCSAAKHSMKPNSLHELIEQGPYPRPYIELFARRRRKGWVCMGNEIDKRDIRIAIDKYLRELHAID